MKKMNDSVKYQLEKAEDALRTALKFADKESVYVISAISKALIEIDNTMFAECIAERIEAAATKGNTSAQGLISIDKEEQADGKVAYNFTYGNPKPEMNNTSFKWDNKTEFIPANPTVSE